MKVCAAVIDIQRRLGRSITACCTSSCARLLVDGGFRRGDVGPGLIERHLEVAVVDPRQHLAGLHMLVIADQNLVK